MSDVLPPPLRWLEETPFYQAGLQGYSDAAMRIVARRHGAPYCTTEALLDTLLVRGGKGLDDNVLDPEDHPIAGQIIGASPDGMAEAARALLALGYDVIDVNLACPVRKQTNPRGGHLLADPDAAIAIVRAVRDAVAGAAPLTVKLRRGTDDSPEAEGRFHRILEAVIDAGYVAATVHGRTVAQKYDGPSRWSFLRDLTRRYREFPILGSGDIFEARDIFAMLRETGVRGVSVARGAIGNPWIFREAHALLRGGEPASPTLGEQRRALEELAEIAIRAQGEAAGRRLRKFGIKSSRHHPLEAEVARAFIDVRTVADWRDVIERYYGADALAASVPLESTESPSTCQPAPIGAS